MSNQMTNLKRLRAAAGLSQSQLSTLSGVNVRMIQFYEQRVKDINRAEGMRLYQLSRVLGCRIEDLLEK